MRTEFVEAVLCEQVPSGACLGGELPIEDSLRLARVGAVV